jgi:DNA-binding response OmpR family regulator
MSKGHVLVVDGNETIREIVESGLVESGYEVRHVPDGAEALEAIRTSRPALVISDVDLPVMDGWALCEEIRHDQAIDDVPFIFLTAEIDIPKRIKGLSLGADDYICVPFSVGECDGGGEAHRRRCLPRRSGHLPIYRDTPAIFRFPICSSFQA